MASSSGGSFNRKYRVSTSGRFSRDDERDGVVRGARSMERLNSLDGEKPPHLIFTTGHGSFVRQRQEELLRSATLSGSQPRLDSLSTHSRTLRPFDNDPTTSVTTSTTITFTTNSNSNENTNVTKDSGPRRSSSYKLPRIPSKTLRDLDFLRIKRRSDVIRRGEGREGKEEGDVDKKRKTEKPSCDDLRQSSSSSPPSSETSTEVTDFPTRHGSENCDEVVMRRKTSSDVSPKWQTSEQTFSDRAWLSRPSSVHSERNSSRSTSWRANPSVKNARPLSSSSRFNASKPGSAVLDKDSSSGLDKDSSSVLDKDSSSGISKRSSTDVERSSSLRDVRHTSLFSERYAFWSKPTRSSFLSERAVSLTNLSTHRHTGNQDSADTESLVNHSYTSGNSSSRTDSEMQGNVQSKAAMSVPNTLLKSAKPKGVDNNSFSQSDLSVSLLASHPTPLSSPRADVQTLVNYDGSGLDVMPSLPDSMSPDTTSGKRSHRSPEMKRTSAVAEKIKDRTKNTQSASSTKADKANSKGAARTTGAGVPYTDVTLEKVDPAPAAASVPRFSPPSNHLLSPPPTIQPTRTLNGTSSRYADAQLPDADRESESQINRTSADAVLSYLDDALESHSTDPALSTPPSVSSHHPTHRQPQTITPQSSENLSYSVSMAKTIDTSNSVCDDGLVNSFSNKSMKTETSTGNATSGDLDVTLLHIEEKKKRHKAKRKASPTKVTKYEGSVKTVRRQIKPGHVDELREMFKKQEEENDKLVMRHRKHHPGSQDVGSMDDADDSGSGYSTTSSDNEYDLEQAERLNNLDRITSPPMCPPSSQCDVRQQEENTTAPHNASRKMSIEAQANVEGVEFKESFQIKNVSDSFSKVVVEMHDTNRESGETSAKESSSFLSNAEAHSPQVSPTAESTSVNTAHPQASVLSVDLTRHAPHTAESKVYTGSTTLSLSNTVDTGTRFPTSRNDEAMENKGMNSVKSHDVLFERTGKIGHLVSFEKSDDISHLQPKTDESAAFKSVIFSTNSRDRGSSSNPSDTSSKKRRVLHQETPTLSQTFPMMDDCQTSLQPSPPPISIAGRGEEEPARGESGGKGEGGGELVGRVDSDGKGRGGGELVGRVDSDSKGGLSELASTVDNDGKGRGGELAGKVDSDGPSTIFWPNDHRDDDMSTARRGGGRGSPDSPAEKEIDNNTVSPTTPCLQVFESRNKNLTGGEKGEENATINRSLPFTSPQTPPLAVSSQQTGPMEHVTELPTKSDYSPPCPDTDRQEGRETPVDFMSLLDNIHLDTSISFNAKMAQRARQLYSKDSTDEKRNSVEIPSWQVNGFESECVRKEEGSGGFSLKEFEDGGAHTVDAGLVSTTSVTLFTNDTVLPEPAGNESTTYNMEGKGQNEKNKPKKDGGEVHKPGDSWISSLPMLTSRDRERKAGETSTSSDTKDDTKADTEISNDNTSRTMEITTMTVKDICTVSNDNVMSNTAAFDSKDMNFNTNSTSNTTHVDPGITLQTSEASLTLVMDKSNTDSVPKEEVFGEESVTSSEADKDEQPQKSWDRPYEMDVVAGNIRVKHSPPPTAVSTKNTVRGEDEHIRFLKTGSDHEGPSKTSSQVLYQSRQELPASFSTSKERHRPSKRQVKSIIMSTTTENSKPDTGISLPRQLESESHVNPATDSTVTASVVTAITKDDSFPSKINTSSSQQTPITDSALGRVSEHKILDRAGELHTEKSPLHMHKTTVRSDGSAGISVQDNKHKTNENYVTETVPNTRYVSSRISSSDSHQTHSRISINLDPNRTREDNASDISSDVKLDGKMGCQISYSSTKERDETGEKYKVVSLHPYSIEESPEKSSGGQYIEGALPSSNDKKASSRVLVLNTSMPNSALQDSTSLNNNSNTSFGDNDSQYGSQTSKATSVGDASPTDERLYRITHPDTSLSSTTSSILPLNPPPSQQHVVYSSLDSQTRATAKCQQDSLNRSHDDIFSQHNSDNVPDVWRTGRLALSDPDLSCQSLFDRPLSIQKETKTEQRKQREAEYDMRRVRSSPSESDEDSGVEGGRRYKSETKLDLDSTKRRANSTGSLSNVHLSLLPHSPTSSPGDYRVSSLQSQTSWETTQEGAGDQSKNVYRVSQIKTVEDVPNEVERKIGQGALKRQSWSPPRTSDENSSQAFKVLHTLPTQKSSLIDDEDFRRNEMTSQHSTPFTASQSFEESRSNRTRHVSPSHWTGSPTDVRQQHSVIPPDVGSQTNTSAAHWTEPQYIASTLRPADYSETRRETDRVSREHSRDQELEKTEEPVSVCSSEQNYPERNQDTEVSLGQASAHRHFPSDDGSDMDYNPSSKTYCVSTTANLHHRPTSLRFDSSPDYDMYPDYDNIPADRDSRRYIVHNSPRSSTANTIPSLDPRFLEEEKITLREVKPTVTSPPSEPRPLFYDRTRQAQADYINSNDIRNVQNDVHTTSPLQQQRSRNHVTFSSLDNIQDSARDVSNVRPSRQQYFSQNSWSPEQPWMIGSPSPITPTQSAYRDFHSDQHYYNTSGGPTTRHSEGLRRSGRDMHTTSITNDADDDNDSGTFQREVYEETSYQLCQDTTTVPHVLPEVTIPSEEEKDLRVLRGKILIQNRLDDSRAEEEDFPPNMNVFDTSFHLDKDNPLYQSDPDIYKALEAELQQQEDQRRQSQAIGQEVTQDVTWETVERVARRHKEEQQNPKPQRPKQNLSTLLLSKLSSIHSQDIRQTIDVKHHNEDVFGAQLHLMHADGSRAAAPSSSHTSNFDSVHENIELLLKEGKAFVIIKVIAERIAPVDPEFDVWRKSQAIVTRNIEIDLHATEQRRRLYQNVMDSGGRVPGVWRRDVTDSAWDDDDVVGESWAGGGFEEGGSGGGATLRSSGGEFEERQLSSLETLRLFSQILGVAEEEIEGREGGRYGQERGGLQGHSPPPHPPPSASAMDLLY